MDYFFASMTLQSQEIGNKEDDFLVESIQRKTLHRQVHVPPLLVKRIPARKSGSQSINGRRNQESLKSNQKQRELQKLFFAGDIGGKGYVENPYFVSIITNSLAEM